MDDDLARACAAFGANATRLELLELIAKRGEVTSREAMDWFGMTRSAVCRHLRILAAEGVISARLQRHSDGIGRAMHWKLNEDEFLTLIDALASPVVAARR